MEFERFRAQAAEIKDETIIATLVIASYNIQRIANYLLTDIREAMKLKEYDQVFKIYFKTIPNHGSDLFPWPETNLRASLIHHDNRTYEEANAVFGNMCEVIQQVYNICKKKLGYNEAYRLLRLSAFRVDAAIVEYIEFEKAYVRLKKILCKTLHNDDPDEIDFEFAKSVLRRASSSVEEATRYYSSEYAKRLKHTANFKANLVELNMKLPSDRAIYFHLADNFWDFDVSRDRWNLDALLNLDAEFEKFKAMRQEKRQAKKERLQKRKIARRLAREQKMHDNENETVQGNDSLSKERNISTKSSKPKGFEVIYNPSYAPTGDDSAPNAVVNVSPIGNCSLIIAKRHEGSAFDAEKSLEAYRELTHDNFVLTSQLQEYQEVFNNKRGVQAKVDEAPVVKARSDNMEDSDSEANEFEYDSDVEGNFELYGLDLLNTAFNQATDDSEHQSNEQVILRDERKRVMFQKLLLVDSMSRDIPIIPRERPCEADTEINKILSLYTGEILNLEVDMLICPVREDFSSSPFFEKVIKAGGPKLLTEFNTFNTQNWIAGQAKVTRGYNLPAKFVAFTVVPNEFRPDDMYKAMDSSLAEFKNLKLRTIASPTFNIATTHYPLYNCIHQQALSTRRWMDVTTNRRAIDRIIFCVNNTRDFNAYSRILPLYYCGPQFDTTVMADRLAVSRVEMEKRFMTRELAEYIEALTVDDVTLPNEAIGSVDEVKQDEVDDQLEKKNCNNMAAQLLKLVF